MNIAIIGYGKMGKAIEEIAMERGHIIMLKIDGANQNELTREALHGADVALEFTGPDSAIKNIVACFDAGIPVVCGSTGWIDKLEEVKKICLQMDTAFIYASNFSIGVNIFFELNRKLAALMSNRNAYTVEMEEIHHTAKKDSPSGTAISLAEQILGEILRLTSWVNEPSTRETDLQITSKRIDPAAGTHRIAYRSEVDDIEIIHTAHNRSGFALGAVLAAEYLPGKKGCYTMKDVLGILEGD